MSTADQSSSQADTTEDWGASFMQGSDKSETDWESIFDQIIQSHRGTKKSSAEDKGSLPKAQLGECVVNPEKINFGLPSHKHSENGNYSVDEGQDDSGNAGSKETFVSNCSRDLDSFDIEFSYHSSRPGASEESAMVESSSVSKDSEIESQEVVSPANDLQKSAIEQQQLQTTDIEYKEIVGTKCSFYDVNTSEGSSNDEGRPSSDFIGNTAETDEGSFSTEVSSSYASTESGSYVSSENGSSFTDNSREAESNKACESGSSERESEDWSGTSYSITESQESDNLSDESGRSTLGSENISGESNFEFEHSQKTDSQGEDSGSSSSGSTPGTSNIAESDSAIDENDEDDEEESDSAGESSDEGDGYGSSEFEGILDDDTDEEEESIHVDNSSLSEDVFREMEVKGYTGLVKQGSEVKLPEIVKENVSEATEEICEEANKSSIDCSPPKTLSTVTSPSMDDQATPQQKTSFRSCSYQQLPDLPVSTPNTVPVIRNSMDEILARNLCGSAEPYQRRDSPVLRLFNRSTPIKHSGDYQSIPNIKMEDLIPTPMSSTPKAESAPLLRHQLHSPDHNVPQDTSHHNVPQHQTTSHQNVSLGATPTFQHLDNNVARQRAVSGPAKLPASSDSTQQQQQQKEREEREEKMQRRRAKIVQEIFDTEATYQQHLHLILKYFEFPLRKSAVLPDRVISSIFGNIRQIVSLSQELMSRLSEPPQLQQQPQEQPQIGQAFLLMGPFLKLYSMYANNHEQALATLMEWDQKCPDFAAFRRQQEDLPDMNGLKLNALLITPVQRIPRYKLLLTDLMQNTPTDHKDYPALQEAVEQIGCVAAHINEHIKQQDNFSRMLQIQKSLSGAAAPRLLTPGRCFVKEGPLRKVSKKGGRSYERMFYLFSDMLMYAKPRLLDAGSTHHAYTCCCVFPLQHCQVTRVFGHSTGQGALFSITCKHESVLLYSDQKTVESWIETISRTIEKLRENRKSLRKASSLTRDPLRSGVLSRLRKQREENTPQKKTRSLERPSLPSPSQALKRALRDSDINCLSPKRKAEEGSLDLQDCGQEKQERLSGLGAGLTSAMACVSGRAGKLKRRKAMMKKNTGTKMGFPHRYPSTPDALDSLDTADQDVIDLDQSDVWRLHNDTMDDTTEVTPKSNRHKSGRSRSGQRSGKEDALKNPGLEDILSGAADTAQHLFLPSPAPQLSQGYGATCVIQ